MLKTSVTRFNEDLNQLSSHIKNKQTSQIRQTIKNKSYASAGIVQKTEVSTPKTIIHPSPSIVQQQPQQQQPTPQVVIQEQVIFHQPSTIKIEHQLPTELVTTSQPQTSSHMTLNRLNAQEEEMDDDTSFDNEVKIETSFSEVSWSNLNGLVAVTTNYDNDEDEDEHIENDENDDSEEFLSDDDECGADFLS